MSVDPVLGNVSHPQQLNRYSYVGNDPANLVDPDGRSPCIAIQILVVDTWVTMEYVFCNTPATGVPYPPAYTGGTVGTPNRSTTAPFTQCTGEQASRLGVSADQWNSFNRAQKQNFMNVIAVLEGLSFTLAGVSVDFSRSRHGQSGVTQGAIFFELTSEAAAQWRTQAAGGDDASVALHPGMEESRKLSFEVEFVATMNLQVS